MSSAGSRKIRRIQSPDDSNKTQSRHRDLRAEIAYRAARLIAEDGVTSVLAAKRKAARQVGVTEAGFLPDNDEIDAALRSYQSLFQGETQRRECRALREIAVKVMYRLRHFSPWLVGAVLNGSANRFSPIELEIVEYDAKKLEMFFLCEGIRFDTRVIAAIAQRGGATLCDVSIYEVLFSECPVSIALYPIRAAREAHHPRNDPRSAGAKIKDVEALLW